MYSPDYWQKCFPEMFPYGDGVYGIMRDRLLTFREWASCLLERTELEHSVPELDDPMQQFQPPAIPRRAGDLNFLSVACDTWKRMDMVRLASAHVKRRQFKHSLQAVLHCTSERLRAAVAALGDNANLGDMMRSSVVDSNIRDALPQLLFFSSEVVGTDGARQQLRHEQNGAMLMLLRCKPMPFRAVSFCLCRIVCVQSWYGRDARWRWPQRVVVAVISRHFCFGMLTNPNAHTYVTDTDVQTHCAKQRFPYQ